MGQSIPEWHSWCDWWTVSGRTTNINIGWCHVSCERPYPWGQMHKNMQNCIKTQHFANKNVWKSSWHSWFHRSIFMLDPKLTDWTLQTDAHGFMHRASDVMWINQWSIPEPDCHWQWNQGASCPIRYKDGLHDQETHRFPSKGFQDSQLCAQITANGTCWWVSNPDMWQLMQPITTTYWPDSEKLFKERGWSSSTLVSSSLMIMWPPTQPRWPVVRAVWVGGAAASTVQPRPGTFRQPFFCASEAL
jgi:hypothetical protein